MRTLWDVIKADADGDFLIQVAPQFWHLDPEQNPERSTMTVRAPCCGESVAAEDVIDVRHISGTWIERVVPGGRGKIKAWTDPGWLCGSCASLLYRTAAHSWTPAKLARACGCTDEEVAEFWIREVLDREFGSVMGNYRETLWRGMRDELKGPKKTKVVFRAESIHNRFDDQTKPPNLPEPPRRIRTRS